ncbi:MAG: DUF2520 domain-containing protein [Phycisphaerales bacterium]|nr:DUF2520 domain-containing protein [Phycisphaerales bacterium]
MSDQWHDMPVAILGCGRVGGALAIAMHEAGTNDLHLTGQRAEHAAALAERLAGTHHATMQGAVDAAKLVIVTVPDDAIEPVVAGLKWSDEHTVLHCCGLHTLDVLDSARASGASVGSLHPLMAITDPNQGAASLSGATFAIEGEGDVQTLLERIVTALGGRAVAIAPDQRALYHASAMLVGGYLSALGAEAAALWQQLGLDPQDGIKALTPMMGQVAANLRDQGVPDALAGSVQRGDVGTVQAHLETLAESSPRSLALYIALARTSLQQARDAGHAGQEQLDAIEAALIAADASIAP